MRCAWCDKPAVALCEDATGATVPLCETHGMLAAWTNGPRVNWLPVPAVEEEP